MPAQPRLRTHAAGWSRLVSSLFGREAVKEAVATRVRFDGRPEEVWDHIMFYEEVPGRPAFLLRTLLPYPVRAEGDKTHVGETVRCAYRGGDLAKRITAVNPRTCCDSKSSNSAWASRIASSRLAVRITSRHLAMPATSC